MGKLRLTKNELKKQREDLKRFNRYLPMLQLKKKQLQLEIIKTHQAIKAISSQIQGLKDQVIQWVDVFAEEFPFDKVWGIKTIKLEEGNIAGIDIPIFRGVEFKEEPFDLLLAPLWVDKALEVMRGMMTFKAEVAVLLRQQEILREELRIANQRVNLFEKVKIPEGRENIRVIHIHLGEVQTAEMVRGKIAKAKIELKKSQRRHDS